MKKFFLFMLFVFVLTIALWSQPNYLKTKATYPSPWPEMKAPVNAETWSGWKAIAGFPLEENLQAPPIVETIGVLTVAPVGKDQNGTWTNPTDGLLTFFIKRNVIEEVFITKENFASVFQYGRDSLHGLTMKTIVSQELVEVASPPGHWPTTFIGGGTAYTEIIKPDGSTMYVYTSPKVFRIYRERYFNGGNPNDWRNYSYRYKWLGFSPFG